VHDLPFGEALSGEELRSSVIVIEENLAPAREKMRKPVRELWRRLLSEGRRTASRSAGRGSS
jgi:hypothetical protein